MLSLFGKKVADIMTCDVEIVGADTNLQTAAETMRRLDIGVLPVGSGRNVQGIITDRDIVVRGVAEALDPRATRVGDLMTRDVVHCYDDQEVHEAAQLMKDKQIRRLLVFSRDEMLCGVLSLGDLAVDFGDDKVSGKVLEKISEPSSPRQR